MYQRHILQNVLNSLADTPAVFIRGPRQAGKTTLVQQISAEHYPAAYVTLDDLTVCCENSVLTALLFLGATASDPALMNDLRSKQEKVSGFYLAT